MAELSELAKAAEERKERTSAVRRAAEASDACWYPILDIYTRDDPSEYGIRCTGLEMADLHDGKWLTAYHQYEVIRVTSYDNEAGVIVVVRHHPE